MQVSGGKPAVGGSSLALSREFFTKQTYLEFISSRVGFKPASLEETSYGETIMRGDERRPSTVGQTLGRVQKRRGGHRRRRRSGK